MSISKAGFIFLPTVLLDENSSVIDAMSNEGQDLPTYVSYCLAQLVRDSPVFI